VRSAKKHLLLYVQPSTQNGFVIHVYPMHCTAPSIAAVADVWIRPHVIYLFFYL